MILRGLPGVGKSTFAASLKRLCNSNKWTCRVCSADDWFRRGDRYQFDAHDLPEAHRYCQGMCLLALYEQTNVIIIDNTNISYPDVDVYRDLEAHYDCYDVRTLEWKCQSIEQAAVCLQRSNVHVRYDDYPLERKFQQFWPTDDGIPMPIVGLNATNRERDAFMRGYPIVGSVQDYERLRHETSYRRPRSRSRNRETRYEPRQRSRSR